MVHGEHCANLVKRFGVFHNKKGFEQWQAAGQSGGPIS
jgi:hypothetical protein